ncbi:MAG: glutathione S-transferase [Robiginitomaculum sp.]|nr:MAG: glutathione S-transferase [Robiginitomaculum sp.]
MIRLYSFRRCPYAMRARMGLHISGVDYEHREILLRDKPSQMLEVSPKGTVPVLILQDGTVIDESFDIMLWALKQNDPENWLTHTPLDTIRPLIETITTDFKHHLDRYKYASRYNEGDTRASIDLSHREQACNILQTFEDTLSASPFLMGEKACLADYAIFPFIRQFSNVEREWWDSKPFPYIHAWLENFLASEIFKAIMKKHPIWAPEP